MLEQIPMSEVFGGTKVTKQPVKNAWTNCLVCFIMIVSIYPTEKALKKHFNDDGADNFKSY